MSKKFSKNQKDIIFKCEFLDGTIRAYFVRIGNKEFFLSRQYTKKQDDSICVPLWLAKKAGLMA